MGLTSEPPFLPRAAMAIVLAIVATVILVAFRRRIFQTTLTSGWWWAWGASCAICGVELWAAVMIAGEAAPFWLSGLRLAVGALTVTPALAVMGAKRPQHLAWNWVVLALWGLLLLPVGVAWFRPTATPLASYAAIGWFLWLLIGLNWVNYIPTRFWPVSFLLTGAQVCYLADHLPGLSVGDFWRHVTGLGGFIVCFLFAAWLARRVTVAASPLDRVWLDFRDTFGLFWSLRVQERMNDAAVKLDWPIRLAWSGFVNAQNSQAVTDWPHELERAVRLTLRGLLRRFVSPEWLTARWGDE